MVLSASPAAGQDVEVTPFLAYRSGSSLQTEDGRLQLQASPAWGGLLSYRASDGALVEVMYSQQSTELGLRQAVGTSEPLFDVVVRYVQAGARYRGSTSWAAPHLAFTVGFSNLDPQSAGREQEWGWTAGGGAGVTLPPRAPLAVRVDARVWLTSLHGPETLFCRSGAGCFVSVSGPHLWQGEISAGVSFAF
jgi:hypothetical protein